MTYDPVDPSSHLRSIDESPEISERNAELLHRFDRDLATESYSDRRRYKLLGTLKKIAEQVEVAFDEAEQDDVRDLVAWINDRDVSGTTKNDYRIVLKRFYRWVNHRVWGNRDEHPDMVEWIETGKGNAAGATNNKLPKDLLTQGDVEDLIGAAQNLRDKALIALLWETGARYGELITLTVGDIEDREHGQQVVVEGKTGSRRIPLREAVPYLNKWLAEHPDPSSRSAYLFCKFNDPEETPSHNYINTKVLRGAAERAGIDKPVNPHHFRHSRASFLANRFTEAQLCEWFGWVQGSDMAAKYVHLSGRDIDRAFNELHGIQTDEDEDGVEEAVQECHRCGELLEKGADRCHGCGAILDQEEALLEQKREEVLNKMLADYLESHPDVAGVHAEELQNELSGE